MIEAYTGWETGEPQPTVEWRGKAVPISQVCGLLWNCTDIMPSGMCQSIDDVSRNEDVHQGSTYARGARVLKYLIDREAA